jgi:hypothetical protein
MPWLPFEDLPPVPAEEAGFRAPLGPLRGPDLLAVVAQQCFLEPRGAVGLVGDEQHAGVVQGEGTQVERLVVQHAQGQAVALLVGAVGLVPADVGRVQGDGHRAQPHVEAAHGAAVLVGRQHPLAELRVAFSQDSDATRAGERYPAATRSKSRPEQGRLQATPHPQGPAEDVHPRPACEVEDPEQVELLAHVLGAADLVGSDIERVVLGQAGGLDLD